MRGFQPAGDKTLQKKSAGPVRGPGTGTSDDVPAQVQDGTYIMPTDSTEAIGEQNLAAMGKGAPVDVNLSNGEFKLPPDQVHAVGVQALDQMKDATHTPVAARGLPAPAQQPGEPPLFFVNGGEVDKDKPNLPSPTNIFPGNRLPGTSGATSAPPAAAPAAPVKQSEALTSQLQGLPAPQFQRDLTQRQQLEGQIQSAQANERYDAAGPQMAAEARAAATMRMNRAANRPLAPAALPASAGEAALAAHDSGGAGAGRGSINPALAVPTPSAPAAAPGAAPLATAATAGPGQGRGTINPPLVNPNAPAPTSTVASPTEIAPGVFRSGNSYADTAAGAVAGPQTRGLPSVQNMAAAEALSQQSQQASTARVMAGQPTERGWSGVIGTAPGTNAAGRERQDLVASLTTPLRGAQNGQLTATQRSGMLSLLDQEARGFQAKANNATALQQTEMQTSAQRDMTAMREAGDNSRAVLREAGETSRAGARSAIDQGRLNLEQQAKGFAIRFGEREEKLHQRYEKAKNPEEKDAIAKQIRDLSGKADPTNRFTVVPGGQEWDTAAGAMRNVPGRVLNNQTGEFVGQQSSPKPAAPLPPRDQLQSGQIYQTPQGPARWDGKAFSKV